MADRMIRLVVSLLGLAVLFAVFAGVAYSRDGLQPRTVERPTFNLAPGDSQDIRLLPTVAQTPIAVEIDVVGGPIDVFVMPRAWSDHLAEGGGLNLSQPFSYDAALSRTNVNGTYSFSIISDGEQEYLVILDNSDDHYDGDAAPDLGSPTNGTASAKVTIRYLEVEQRSLVFGFIAASPAILLIAITVVRRVRHHLRKRRGEA